MLQPLPPVSLLCVLLVTHLTSVASIADPSMDARLDSFGERLEALEEAVAAIRVFQTLQFETVRTLAEKVLGVRQAVRLGGTCDNDADCRLSEKSVCQAGVCGCPEGYWNFINSTCRAAAAEGEPCGLEGDCTATRADLSCSGWPRRCAARTCGASVVSGYKYRLVGGASCSEGRVQALGPDWAGDDDSEFWQVCADDWGPAEARVVCRSLHRSGGEIVRAEALRNHRVWKVSLDCGGSERGLHECVRRLGRVRIGISYCRERSVVTVRCEPRA